MSRGKFWRAVEATGDVLVLLAVVMALLMAALCCAMAVKAAIESGLFG